MKKRVTGLMGALAVSGLLAAGSAEANTVTIGSPGPASTLSAVLGEVATVVNTSVPGATVTAPGNGVVTSWKIANASGGPFTLQVVHPAGGLYSATGSSAPGAVTGSGILTFPSDVPIAKGDLIGIVNSADTDHIGASITPGSAFIFFVPPLGSAARSQDGGDVGEIGFNAQVLLNCVVPKLKGKKLGAAKKALAKAGCAPPTVKKKGGKFVIKQKPGAGKEIRGDAPVKLTAGPKKK
jgi:hypothetical protein